MRRRRRTARGTANSIGLVLTALYLLRRDLASNMLAHGLTDGVGFLLG
ncbi:MAG: hypothetical protein L0219_16035 [Phycisphaerales bacterium]|nr:hypothetical protein [Phycisphaerales bacterium]